MILQYVGLAFFFVGAGMILLSFSSITGFVILGDTGEISGSILGIFLIIIGILLMVIKNPVKMTKQL